MNKKNITLIIISLIIIIIISLIWLLKNNQKNDINIQNISLQTENINPDFELNIRDTLDLDHLKTYKLPIIIDFGSEYCIPCKEMLPHFKSLHNKVKGKAILKYIDILEHPKVANQFPIELIPTQFFFNSDGTPYNVNANEKSGFEIIKDNSGKHIYTIHIGILTEEDMLVILKEMGLNE